MHSLIVHKITVITHFGLITVATGASFVYIKPLNCEDVLQDGWTDVCHRPMSLCQICRNLRIALIGLLPSASTVDMVEFAVHTLSTTKPETFMTYIILIGALLAVAVLFMAMDEKSY